MNVTDSYFSELFLQLNISIIAGPAWEKFGFSAFYFHPELGRGKKKQTQNLGPFQERPLSECFKSHLFEREGCY